MLKRFPRKQSVRRTTETGCRWLCRREFLKLLGAGVCSAAFVPWADTTPSARAQMLQKGLIKIHPAEFYRSLPNRAVQCELCPRRCTIEDGRRGVCRVRENRSGTLTSLVYGNPCAFHLDPVERIPFFHVLPGTASLALATAGCNFSCKFCQTWEISQAAPEEVFGFDVPPDIVVQRAGEMGARSVSYTFVEPVVFFEYMTATGRRARENGLLSLMHSNGYINAEPLKRLSQTLDAANIDLKSLDDGFYSGLCEGSVAPVMETLEGLKKAGVHLEVTNLVVPSKNDDRSRIRELCGWIKEVLGPNTPLHFWRFYPLYKLRNLPPTPAATLEEARRIALDVGLNYVYMGNMPGHEGENTFCHSCKSKIISRTGFMVEEVLLEDGTCRFCKAPVPGIWL